MTLLQEIILYTLLLIVAIALCCIDGISKIFVAISKLYIILCTLLIIDKEFWKVIIKND